MNAFKKSITFLIALSFMPSPKAAADEWSYGIKIGAANSFMTLSPTAVKEVNKKTQYQINPKDKSKIS
ncbi:MAG: hypothetical protein V3581_01050 [Candidatus Cardinium sp.]